MLSAPFICPKRQPQPPADARPSPVAPPPGLTAPDRYGLILPVKAIGCEKQVTATESPSSNQTYRVAGKRLDKRKALTTIARLI